MMLCCLFFSVSAQSADISGVGVKRLQFLDPVTSKPMSAAAFFPSSTPSKVTSIGPYDVAASRNAMINEGRYPIIVMSHGNRGSMWSHHGLATELARGGYIVVAVMHPGDNFEDFSGAGSVSVIYGRPKQISAGLDAAIDDPELAPHVDITKVGFVGFSAGGMTGLILSGARPELDRLEDYCVAHPKNTGVCEAKGQIQIDQADLQATADPRFQAFVLLSPLSVVFSPEEIRRTHKPMLIAVGERDDELFPRVNAIALARELPNAQLKLIAKAGHFAFLAPCSPQLTAIAPALCTDGEGFDRIAFQEELNIDIVDYFNRKLGAS